MFFQVFLSTLLWSGIFKTRCLVLFRAHISCVDNQIILDNNLMPIFVWVIESWIEFHVAHRLEILGCHRKECRRYLSIYKELCNLEEKWDISLGKGSREDVNLRIESRIFLRKKYCHAKQNKAMINNESLSQLRSFSYVLLSSRES